MQNRYQAPRQRYVADCAQLGSFKTLSETGDLVYLKGTPLFLMLLLT